MTHPIRITQAELSEIVELERDIAWKTKHLADMRETVSLMLREGVPIEEGRFDAWMATRIGRNVRWKQAFVERLGQAEADAVKIQCRTHVYLELEVREHAVMPLWKGREGENKS